MITSRNEEQTEAIGAIIGRTARGGDSVALFGDLGSGKTCITRGIAEGIGVSHDYCIASPTFTLVNEYPGRIPLYHMDMYRLASAREMSDLGYDDYFRPDGIVVIEWADKVIDMLPTKSLRVHLKHVDETTREIEIEGEEERIVVLVEKLHDGGFQEWR